MADKNLKNDKPPAEKPAKDSNRNQPPATDRKPSITQLSRMSKLSFGHYSLNAVGYRKMEPFEEEIRPLEPRASILLPHLQVSEKRFFELVAENEVPPVKEFLQENHGFNINCVNFQGVSALYVAVQNRNEPMVEFLLAQRNIDIGDCILHSIRDNQIKIMLMLLNKLNETAPGLEFVGVTHSSDFPDHVTPLILAAQCGHFEIIETLIERGHIIVKPHPPECRCKECKIKLEQDDILHAESLRLNLYKAITNPAYICHATHDPILMAFRLARELRQCSSLVPEFREAYEDLAEEISTFAVDLLGCCRSTEEMDLILRQREGFCSPGQFLYPRLVLAMDLKQKQFVAHPNTQQMVESAWNGEWFDWKFKPMATKCCYPVIRLTLIPIVAILCIIMPKHSMVKHWAIPLNKMLTHNAAYFLFLILIFLESNLDKTGQRRKPPSSGLEPIIILFVVGYIWSNLRMCMIQGPGRHFMNMWNCFDVISLTLFLLTFFFWFGSYVDGIQNDSIDLERKYWHHLDPLLLAEGTFAVAVIMSYFRLLYICRLNYYLGPLQISLGKMSADIAKYISIFTIILISFSAGMCRYYHYYNGMVQVDDNSGIKTAQVSSFVTFESSLKTFFWALFCMAALESADVIIENLPGETDKTTIINHHEFTEAVGYIVFALFEVLTVIMILNMLIATMSNTFQRVTDNVIVEWIFGKTNFYIEYMIQTTLPPPLNLIPTANGIGSALEWLQAAGKGSGGKSARCSPLHCCYIEREPDEHLAKDFPILMSQLIQRYFREKDANVDKSEDDLEVLKTELVEIRQMLKEALNNKTVDESASIRDQENA